MNFQKYQPKFQLQTYKQSINHIFTNDQLYKGDCYKVVVYYKHHEDKHQDYKAYMALNLLCPLIEKYQLSKEDHIDNLTKRIYLSHYLSRNLIYLDLSQKTLLYYAGLKHESCEQSNHFRVNLINLIFLDHSKILNFQQIECLNSL
jgi:hypothetical protein